MQHLTCPWDNLNNSCLIGICVFYILQSLPYLDGQRAKSECHSVANSSDEHYTIAAGGRDRTSDYIPVWPDESWSSLYCAPHLVRISHAGKSVLTPVLLSTRCCVSPKNIECHGRGGALTIYPDFLCDMAEQGTVMWAGWWFNSTTVLRTQWPLYARCKKLWFDIKWNVICHSYAYIHMYMIVVPLLRYKNALYVQQMNSSSVTVVLYFSFRHHCLLYHLPVLCRLPV